MVTLDTVIARWKKLAGKPVVRQLRCLTPHGLIPVMDNLERYQLLGCISLRSLGRGVFEYDSYENLPPWPDIYWRGQLLFTSL